MPKVQGRESSLNTISDLDLDELEVGLDHVSRCSLLWKHLLNWKAENVAIEPESKKSVMGSTTEPRDDLEGKKLEDEVIGTNLVAFLGPNIWGDDGIKLELDVELSALLGMEDESVEGHQAAASANAETDTETSYPTDPSVDPVVLKDDCPNTFALDAATEETCKPRRLRRNVNRKRKADQTLTPPGSEFPFHIYMDCSASTHLAKQAL
ncbi:unnamed protein product [Darwinula stevensoni]|uniref:Uncharacterized protein n=1 Tax=Darwinula stevensoni TaxID=69355 RepID=A0A7R9A4Y4_9CRUS|nr:unnamed protein product [Darwinula stevensoni]CAG0893456.1 unnamed protein product [Darwinula stevensoni]